MRYSWKREMNHTRKRLIVMLAAAFIAVASILISYQPPLGGAYITVHDQQGNPIPGCHIDKKPANPFAAIPEYATVTDADGQAMLHSLQEGKWDLSISCPNQDTHEIIIHVQGNLQSHEKIKIR
jgi:hypothetical protein